MAQMLGRVTLNLEIEGSITVSSRIFCFYRVFFHLTLLGLLFAVLSLAFAACSFASVLIPNCKRKYFAGKLSMFFSELCN